MRAEILLCLLSASVWADPPPSTTDEKVSDEEVVVVAAREPLPRSAAGSSVSVITDADLMARNESFVVDSLREVPGFSVEQDGGIGKLSLVRVRGAESNHLLVLIDGIEANDFTRGDAFDFSNLLASDISRIEIVRGPQSGLWGSDALAGVMNVITKQATTPFSAHLNAEYGSFDTGLINAGVGGKSDGFNANLGFTHVGSVGTNVSRVGNENDGYRNNTLNLKLGWTPFAALKVDLTGRLVDFDNKTDADLGLGIPSDSPGVTRSFQAYFGGRATLTSFDGHWLNTFSGSGTRISNKDNDVVAGVFGRTFGAKEKLGYQSTWRFNSDIGIAAEHSLTAAIEYERATFHQRGAINFGDPNQDRVFTSAGYVGEYRVTLARYTHLSANGRFDDNHQFDSVWTYRFAVAQDIPQTNTTLSFAYATGQKAPTFAERFGFFSDGSRLFIGNNQLKPAYSRGYELGVSQNLLKDRLNLTATYFSDRLKDEINGFFFDPVLLNFTSINTPGTSTRDGVEFSWSATVNSQVKVNGSYTYLDATGLRNGVRADEIRRPHHSGAASATWKSADARTDLVLHLTLTGGRDDLFFDPNPPFPQLVERLSSYTLVGVSATHQLTPMLALTARIENLANENYEDVFGFRTPGVAGYVGLRVRFDK